MEHRLLNRKIVDLQVDIFSKGQSLARAAVVDMTMHGASLQHPRLSLFSGQVVSVSFPEPAARNGTWFRVPALVVHSDGQCTGLMLTDDPRLQTLIEMHTAEVNEDDFLFLRAAKG